MRCKVSRRMLWICLHKHSYAYGTQNRLFLNENRHFLKIIPIEISKSHGLKTRNLME